MDERSGTLDEALTPTAAGTRAGALARLLRQRMELGESALMLEAIPRESLARALRSLRADRAQAPARTPVHNTPRSGSIQADSTRAESTRSRASMASPADAAQPSSMDAQMPAHAVSQTPTPLPHPPDTLEELADQCRTCQRCGLAESRTHAVVFDGNPQARVMVVGEAPGANEDATGTPFVGAAGKLLDLLLLSVGLSREENVHIANVIKCRPPGNRNPTREEIEACSPYLLRQIELVQPEVILAVGTFSGQLLSGLDETLGKLRGRSHRYAGIPLVVTYHPAALLRNSGWVRPTWDDLQRLRRILDEPSEST